MRDDRERLLDIQEAIERIEKYAARGREVFENDELIQTWISHHLQIIDEAARSLSSGLIQQHPEVPWPQIAGMRNILVHHYFGIDVVVVWTVVERDLPVLKRQVAAMLEELS
ncbi:MAG: HepT-like ribonuclease domain-containing protein [Blastocatellia bacterium]